MRLMRIALCTGTLVLCSVAWFQVLAQEACAVSSTTHPEFTAAIEAKSLGQNDDAIQHMEQCIKEFTGSPAPYYLLGNWCWEAGKRGKAEENWRLARSASPG